jgi:two-component system chemotaxis response regulator CheY
MRLLVVEDSALLRTMFGLAFPSQRHAVVQAEHGRHALALLQDTIESFDVVLLDLRMPDMNGAEFIRGLRRLPGHRRTPVVVTTAEPDDSPLMRDALSAGVEAVVKKPWTPKSLQAAVHQVLNSGPE